MSARKSRFARRPDQVLVITQKRVSGKETYIRHPTPEAADRDIKNTEARHYWQEYGRHWRGRYRVNIYYHERNAQ